MKTIKLRTTISAVALLAAAMVAMPAMSRDRGPSKTVIELPAVPGWYDGKRALYVSTDASDAGVAAAMGANFVPALANALSASPTATDDIYAVTNFAQSNILPSAPSPAGPKNTSPAYTPLWQVSTVTWADPSKATTLRSEDEVLAAGAAKLVTISKTHIVVNCPVAYTPQGGLLQGAKIER